MTELEILEAQLAQIEKAIQDIYDGGQKYQITSASGAGSVRITEQADLATLLKEQEKIKSKIANIDGAAAFVLGIGW